MRAGHGLIESKKQRVITALLAHSTIEGAAASCGISSRTIRRWMKDPKFFAAYRREREQLTQNIAEALRREAGSAVEALVAVAKNGKSESARTSASKVILDFFFRNEEREGLEKRLEALEAVAERG